MIMRKLMIKQNCSILPTLNGIQRKVNRKILFTIIPKVKKENFKKSDSKIYKCNYCGKEFVQKCNRDRHVKSSVCKTNSCPTCGKVFTISGKFASKHISECK